ncbi:MAG TPA: hypothetical protein VFW22_15545 [Pseudolabrys sp.]|nr:hypothetical protein [Pseudolabrys sp.]
MSSPDTCTLRFIRGTQFADRLRSYKIFVNGQQVGMLAHNSLFEVQAPSGPLTVQARIDWGKSKPLTVEAAAGRRIDIEVSNNWGALLALWAATFGAGSYLKLQLLRGV